MPAIFSARAARRRGRHPRRYGRNCLTVYSACVCCGVIYTVATLCMYQGSSTYATDQSGKVANPARVQLNSPMIKLTRWYKTVVQSVQYFVVQIFCIENNVVTGSPDQTLKLSTSRMMNQIQIVHNKAAASGPRRYIRHAGWLPRQPTQPTGEEERERL